MVATGERSLGGRYRVLLFLALAAVFWERLWVRIWKAVLVVAGFTALALLDVLPALPGWLHLIVLAVFAILLAALCYQALSGFRAVGWATARRRLERDNDLPHRPLSGLVDSPVSDRDDRALKIWLAHVRALRAEVRALTLRPPSPGLAARDPYAIRAAVLLVLVIGMVAGYDQAGSRLARAFSIGGGADDDFAVEIWLTPPAYTRRSPVFLNNRTVPGKRPDRIDTPTETTVSARITGRPAWYGADPVLKVGGRTIPLAAIGGPGNDGRQSFRGETVIRVTDGRKQRLGIRANGTGAATWPLAVIPDRPPTVEFNGPPEPDDRSRVAFAYLASDDYAIERLTLEIRLQDRTLLAGGQITSLDLPVAGSAIDRRRLQGRFNPDLTAHPWAGLPVELRLLAGDGAAQEGAGKAVRMVLPERQFSNPVARAIIVQRRRLALLNPESRQKIARDVIVGLDLIKREPPTYKDSTTVFLALGVAQARLRYGKDRSKYDSVMELLWNTAISLEDGSLAVTERELEQARKDLRDAMSRNAGQAEIDRLMDRVSKALDNYLAALAEKMQADGGTETEFDPIMKMLGAGDLREMLDRARELARTGATGAARRMLSELDRILAGVQDATRGGAAMAAMNKALRQFGDMLDRTRRLAEQQQGLLDKTFADVTDRAVKTPGQLDSAAAAQRARRNELGQIMLDSDELLKPIPAPLGRADRDMMGAAKALGRGRLPAALERQTGAVENLRQAIRDMSAQMAQMMAGAFGMSLGNGPGRMPGGRDPFGRLTGQGGAMSGGTVGIPERGQVQRSRRIIDELRRRSGQRDRPRAEREYIERLLGNF